MKARDYRTVDNDTTNLLRGVLAAVYAFAIALVIIWGIHAAHAEETETETEKDSPTGYKLMISWDQPTSLEDGAPLAPEHITGFDVFHSLDGVADEYLEWVPVQSTPRHTWHHQTQHTGTHCYQLRTVTEKYGKSKRSEPQCITLIANPNPPGNVTATKADNTPLEGGE